MAWIRSPWWDGCWILSGLPVGLALLFMPQGALLAFFALIVLLETAHSFSPIVLAWTNSDFRREVIYRKPTKYLMVPGGIVGVAIGIGAITSLGLTSLTYGQGNLWRITDLSNPLPVMMWIYWVWNIYHFGMQNFGVLSLYRRNNPREWWQRCIDKYSCLGITAIGMAGLPAVMHSQRLWLVCFGVFSFSHWATAIGLCSAASRHSWLFIGSVLALGAVGFVWMVPTSHGNMIRVIPAILSARIGLGFVHFLYDRWIWKFSDPQVRATIGKELFA